MIIIYMYERYIMVITHIFVSFQNINAHRKIWRFPFIILKSTHLSNSKHYISRIIFVGGYKYFQCIKQTPVLFL